MGDHTELDAAVIKYLVDRAVRDEDFAHNAGMAIEAIRSAMGVSEETVSGAKSLSEMCGVQATTSAVKEEEKGKAITAPEEDDPYKELFKDKEFKRKFDTYISKLKERKYFDVPEDEYQKRYKRAVEKFVASHKKAEKEKASARASAPPSEPSHPKGTVEAPRREVSEEDRKEALNLKAKGNTHLTNGEYDSAIACYTKAIELSPEAVFFSNRAAVYSRIGNHEKAVEDGGSAIKLDPKYIKGYSRKGHALFSLGRHEEALAVYKQAHEIDPNQPQIENAIAQIEAKLRAAPPLAANPLAGMMQNPAMAQAMQQMMGGGAGASAGGGPQPDLGSLLGSPEVQNMMEDPQIRQMAEQMQGSAAGAGGGQPDLASMMSTMMSNPQMMEAATQAMQNPALQQMMGSLLPGLMQNPEALNGLLGSMGAGGGGDLSSMDGGVDANADGASESAPNPDSADQ
mmetsp:Transcript_23235/g.65236  ORF Transcript_23235/g.65236 Transcript_23235/m.65236 type:complete len:456 (+) Transcript_23235:81-1448(+)|eukprot:CAMPEP_0119131436 /NCGR_PEP_ID=MMETSP1310-20130426/10388_1 /TAXON_ID=464262 /ORGANISM="Genus nov. species nov., Strain RCC2339" /LENGTH=455 /DNA_ID=CAMNT_0007122009 /DNA_START=81 /DNA_END=1451 /DNA_ORIENTATION=-